MIDAVYRESTSYMVHDTAKESKDDSDIGSASDDVSFVSFSTMMLRYRCYFLEKTYTNCYRTCFQTSRENFSIKAECNFFFLNHFCKSFDHYGKS